MMKFALRCDRREDCRSLGGTGGALPRYFGAVDRRGQAAGSAPRRTTTSWPCVGEPTTRGWAALNSTTRLLSRLVYARGSICLATGVDMSGRAPEDVRPGWLRIRAALGCVLAAAAIVHGSYLALVTGPALRSVYRDFDEPEPFLFALAVNMSPVLPVVALAGFALGARVIARPRRFTARLAGAATILAVLLNATAHLSIHFSYLSLTRQSLHDEP
jgi:hypothetical protein